MALHKRRAGYFVKPTWSDKCHGIFQPKKEHRLAWETDFVNGEDNLPVSYILCEKESVGM